MSYPYNPELWEALISQAEEEEFKPVPQPEFYISSPDEVLLITRDHTYPEYRIIRSCGMTSSTKITANTVEGTFYLIDEEMRKQAFKSRSNGVIGYERVVDLWQDPIVCWGSGVFVRLEPLEKKGENK